MPKLPQRLGYRRPAEWEPHEATWIAWPHNRDDWPGKFAPIPWVVVEVARALAPGEIVSIITQSERAQREARDHLDRAGVDSASLRFLRAPTDRSWTRDTLPCFVVRDDPDQPVGIIDWHFNAWAKYNSYRRDERLPRTLARALGLPRWAPTWQQGEARSRVVLEGGAIDTNGQGTLLTTEECMLSLDQARNPGMPRKTLEQVFHDYLGVRHVVWLGRGISGDDTHGHVDDLARFVNPHTVVLAVETNPADVNFEPLQDNLQRLQQATDQDGRPLDVVPLPMPRPILFEGQRLPASYANLYIGNKAILVPTFNDPADRLALETLAPLFPDREIVGIHCRDLVWGLGTIHCMTHEQPAAPTIDPAL